jgi:uncharacterized protein
MKILLLLVSLFSFFPLYADNFLPVPLVRQATDYSCGPAVLMSVLNYWRVFDGNETELYAPLKTSKAHGTDPLNIMDYVKRLGLAVTLQEGTKLTALEAALARKQPVIVDFQAWSEKNPVDYKNTWEDGHFAVVIGIDSEKIYFMDPVISGAYGHLAHQDFLDRWHDYEMRGGKIVKNYQLAIFIEGKTPLTQFPSPMLPIE